MPLPEDDRNRLLTFQRQVEDLSQRQIVQAGRLEITLRFGQDPTVPILDGVAEDDFRALLIAIRQFMLQRDDTHIYRINNIIQDHCDNENLCGWAVYARELWHTTMNAPVIQDLGNQEQVNLDGIIRLLLYGQIVHRGQEEERRLGAFGQFAPQVFRFEILSSLSELCTVLRLMNNVIHQWLNEPNAIVPEPPAI
jgi:hypothetical protein